MNLFWFFFNYSLFNEIKNIRSAISNLAACNKKVGLPVEGSASFDSHPVDSKVHLSDESRHANRHGVGHTQHHARLFPHYPAEGNTKKTPT